MKRIITLTAAMALLAGAGLASAADLNTSGLKDGASGTFLPQGFYVLAGIGGDITDTKLSGSQVQSPGDFGFAGFAGTAGVGYDVKIANSPWVVGPIARFSLQSVTGATAIGGANQTYGTELGFRFGRTFNNSSLVYAKLAWEDQYVGLVGNSTNLNGIGAGLGLEVDTGNGTFFFSEATWKGYGDWHPTVGATLSEQGIDVTAGLGLRFH